MSRNKSNTKARWKAKDKEYRLGQNARARTRRLNRAATAYAAEHDCTFEEAKVTLTAPKASAAA